jgi:hypothetical protein
MGHRFAAAGARGLEDFASREPRLGGLGGLEALFKGDTA